MRDSLGYELDPIDVVPCAEDYPYQLVDQGPGNFVLRHLSPGLGMRDRPIRRVCEGGGICGMHHDIPYLFLTARIAISRSVSLGTRDAFHEIISFLRNF